MGNSPQVRRSVSAFVGRESELAALESALASAKTGDPRVVLVEGEAGMGKSALVLQFLASCPDVRAIAASGDESETVFPYGVVRQLAVGASAVSPGALAGLPLLGSAPRPDADPLAVGVELLAVTSALPPGEPVIIVIEDLQWVDLPSARALLFALRRLSADRVLAVMTCRPHALGRLDPGWSRFLAGDGRVDRLELAGLSTGELEILCQELGRPALPERTLRRLVEQSGGSPLFIRALLSDLPDDALNASDGMVRVPRSLASLIMPRVAALSPQARDLVLAAAVLGDRSALSDVANVAGLRAPATALDEVERAGLLVESNAPSGWTVSFAHLLVREAVYNDLGPERRRSLHKRAAEVLGPADGLDHRTAAAIGPDPKLAGDLDKAAGESAAAGKLLLAARYLREAASVTSRGPDRDERTLSAFELLVQSADVAGAEYARPSIELLPVTARRDTYLGLLALLAARPRDAEHLLRSAWAEHDPVTESAVGAEAAVGVGSVLLLAGSSTESRQWLDRALRRASGDEPWYDAARFNFALQLSLGGEVGEALGLFNDLAHQAANVPLARTDALTCRGFLRLWTDDVRGATEDLEVAVSRISSGLAVRYPNQALGMLAETEFRAGRWDDGQSHAELAVSLAEDADRDYDLGFVHSVAVPIAACRGEWAVAASHADTAERAQRGFSGLASIFVAHARGLLGFARDDPAEALAGAATALALPEVDQYDDPACFWWRPAQIWALIRTAELDDAEATLTSYESRAIRRGARAAMAHAARLRGMLDMARGDHGHACEVLQSGWLAASGLPFPFCRGLLALEYGRCLSALQRYRDAMEVLRTAKDIFDALGATPFAAAAENELSALGLRPRTGADPDLPGLTAQEARIARLVASGLSNRRVATQLYLSPKTVEYHLAHVFTKLGVHSRHELAAKIGAHGRERR